MSAPTAPAPSSTTDPSPPMLISCCLMAHDYDTTSGGTNAGAPKNPAFAVSITPLDASGNVLGPMYTDPATNEPTANYVSVSVVDEGDHVVPVVASYVDENNQEQLVILSHDRQYPSRFPVSASGACAIKVFGDLSLPELELYDDSHGSTDVLLLEPGTDNTNYLGTIQAADITAATDFSTPPKPILNSSFAGQEGNIATALQKLAGQPQLGGAARRPRKGEPRRARWQPRDEDVGGFTITLTDTTISIGPAAPSLASDVGDFLSSLKSFYRDVVHGLDKVEQITFAAGNFIIQTAKSAWKWAVGELRAAVHAMVGFLKQVVQDVRQLAQWLSFLFDWKAIQANATTISKGISDRLANLIAWVGNTGSSADTKKANPWLESQLKSWQSSTTLQGPLDSPPPDASPALANQGSTYYPQATASTGGNSATIASNTPFASQAPPAQPQPCGTDYTPHSTWLHGKILGDPKFLPSTSATRNRVLGGDADDGSSFSDAIDKVLDDLKAIVQAVDPTQYPAWPGFKADLELLLHNPGTFTLQQLWDTLKQMCDVVAEVFRNVADKIMNTVADVLQALKDLLEQPLFSADSFVGGLLDSVLGMKPTPLNLLSLMLAIPVTLVGKLENLVKTAGAASGLRSASGPVASHHNDKAGEILNMAAAFANGFLALLTAINDAGQQLIKPVSLVVGLASLGAVVLSAPWTDYLKRDSDGAAIVTSSVLLVLQTGPALYNIISVFVPSLATLSIQETAPTYTLYGVIMAILCAGAACSVPKDDYLGFVLPCVGNTFSQVPNMGKFLCYLDDTPGKGVGTGAVVLFDVIGFGVPFATGLIGTAIEKKDG
ncbi:MAG: hypothetical protein JNL97_07785 [Verrucomicrobiales bacterium]|nr:hypothetical protein [Verrucomicrobiales bacterium]